MSLIASRSFRSVQQVAKQLSCGLPQLQPFSTSGEVTPDADTPTGAPSTGKGAAAADPKTLGGSGGPGAGSGPAEEDGCKSPHLLVISNLCIMLSMA